MSDADVIIPIQKELVAVVIWKYLVLWKSHTLQEAPLVSSRDAKYESAALKS